MKPILTTLVVAATLASTAEARVRLTTLPSRERVAVRFEDTGEVLVEESRVLTLDRGLNQVDFTWLGVNIDRSSVQLLSSGDKGPTVLRTTYPPSEPTSLVWEVLSPSNARDTWENVSRYTSIPSVLDILIVHSNKARVELLQRLPGGGWPAETSVVTGGTVHLASIDMELPLARVYHRSPISLE